MGMFDSVIVPCPECGTENEFQSKGGDCILASYTLDSCPPDVLSDVNRHAPIMCSQCYTQYYVKIIGVAARHGKPVDKDDLKE